MADGTSWLDSVLATPTVGVQVVPNPRVFLRYQELLLTFITEHFRASRPATINVLNASALTLDVVNGFTYRFTHDQISVDFKYSGSTEKMPGAFPQLSFATRRGFDGLLHEAAKELESVLKILVEKESLQLVRAGAAAAVDMTPESIPPGLQELVDHMSAPWPNGLIRYQGSVLARLGEVDHGYDRCFHNMTLDRSGDVHTTEVMLDWQRVFEEPQRLEKGSGAARVVPLAQAAMAYFRKLGEEGFTDANT